MFLSWQYQKYPRRPKPSSSQDISPKHVEVDLAWAWSFKNIIQKHKQFKYWNGLGLSFKRKHFKTYQYVGVGMAGPRLNINISKNRNMNYSKIYTKSVCWYDWAWTKEKTFSKTCCWCWDGWAWIGVGVCLLPPSALVIHIYNSALKLPNSAAKSSIYIQCTQVTTLQMDTVHNVLL